MVTSLAVRVMVATAKVLATAVTIVLELKVAAVTVEVSVTASEVVPRRKKGRLCLRLNRDRGARGN